MQQIAIFPIGSAHTVVVIMCLQDQYEITAVRLSQKIQGQCLESKYSEDDIGKKLRVDCRD